MLLIIQRILIIKINSNNSLRFRKSLTSVIQMILTDELKILDDKIEANQAQYNLDRQAAKISALSAKELGRYK